MFSNLVAGRVFTGSQYNDAVNTLLSPARRTFLHTAASLRALEVALVRAHGIDTQMLMEQAGRAVFDRARAIWPEARRWCVVCGTGNNGGDGYVLARWARSVGITVTLIRVGDGDGPVQAHAARSAYLQHGGVETSLRDARMLPTFELIVDALFGIGLNRAPVAAAAEAIAWINNERCPVLSIDVPSGLNADTGATPGECVNAQMTLSLLAWKRGQFTARARAVVGILQLEAVGVDADLEAAHVGSERLLTEVEVQSSLRPRARDAHKGNHGHVLIVGGDEGMGGAALLAAESALRSGAGWVSLATRAGHVGAALTRCPEVMAHAVQSAGELRRMLVKADVVLVGPGLGQSAWSRDLLTEALASGKPLVIDADALNLIAAAATALPVDAIVTPHSGEAARLLGCDVASIESDRFAAARALQARCFGTVVLKGAGTLICSASELVVCDRGNPGMASAGMGDVLAGVIVALRAQGLSAFAAASVGVFVHASAGDYAARLRGERGLVASDLIAQLGRVVNP